MKKIIVTLVLSLLSFGGNAQEILPSLPPIGIPSMNQDTSKKDVSFVLQLEEEKDYPSAILEWKRLAYETTDISLRSTALFRVALLHTALGENRAATGAFERFIEKSSKDERIPQALYHMAVMGHAGALEKLQEKYAETPWKTEAEYTLLWRKSASGANVLGEDASNLRGKLLAERLKEYPLDVREKAKKVTLISAIPGAGHMYLGQWKLGLALFGLSMIFFVALLYSFRFQFWAYGMVYGFVFAFIYIGVMYHAHQEVVGAAYGNRIKAMDSWTDLYPLEPKQILEKVEK